MKGDNLIAKIV